MTDTISTAAIKLGNTYLTEDLHFRSDDTSNLFAGRNASNGNTPDDTTDCFESGNNTFVGMNAGPNNTVGSNNVFISAKPGLHNTTGDRNTYWGSLTGLNNSTGSRNVFLGYTAGYNETGSDKLYIDNSIASIPPIYEEFNNDLLKVNGKLEVTDTVKAVAFIGDGSQLTGITSLRPDDTINLFAGSNAGQSNHLVNQSVHEFLPNKRGIIITMNSRAKLYIKEKKYKEALPFLKASLQLAEEIEANGLIMENYEITKELYKEQQNFSKALYYSEQYNALNDTILILNMRNEFLNRERIRIEGEKKETKKENKDIKEKLKSNLRNFGLIVLSLLAIGSGWFLYLRARQKHNKATIRQQKQTIKAVIEAQESERKRIGRDLHDGIGQQISGFGFSLRRFLEQLQDSDPKLHNVLEKEVGELDELSEELRSISHQVMPGILGKMALVPALEELLLKSFRGIHIEYDFQHYQMDSIRFDEQIETNLYRITQELIHNVIRHSGASSVSIQLLHHKEALALVVEDDGKGLPTDTPESKGRGLLNIESRVHLLNGTIHYETGPTGGTVVQVQIPLS